MENSMAKIAAALVKAQQAFGPALKTSSNPHFKSRYADLAACVEAVMDGLNSNGIALIQKTHQCDNGVMVETVFVHESGEMLSNGVLHVPASKQDPQGYGSALTYARRYSLMAACGIAPEDDDGNAASRKPTQTFNLQAAQKDVAAAKTVDELGKVWATHGAIATAAKDRDGYASLKALCADRKAALEAA
jgi:hypothetical protein